MKALLSVLGEPVVHLVVIGLVIARLAWGLGSEPAAAEAATPKPLCVSCEQSHDSRRACPEIIAKTRGAELD